MSHPARPFTADEWRRLIPWHAKAQALAALDLDIERTQRRLARLNVAIDQLETEAYAMAQVSYPTDWENRDNWTRRQLLRAHNEFRRGVTTDVVRLGEREWQRRRNAEYRARRAA